MAALPGSASGAVVIGTVVVAAALVALALTLWHTHSGAATNGTPTSTSVPVTPTHPPISPPPHPPITPTPVNPANPATGG